MNTVIKLLLSGILLLQIPLTSISQENSGIKPLSPGVAIRVIQNLEIGKSNAKLVSLYEKNEISFEKSILKYDSLLRNSAERERNLHLQLVTEQVRKADVERRLAETEKKYKRSVRAGRFKVVLMAGMAVGAGYLLLK
jgi:hypothetical protein